MQTFASILGVSRTALSRLFSTNASGWNDKVALEHYPRLDVMQGYYRSLMDSDYSPLKELPFKFPQSLDDFGLRNVFHEIYGDKYADYMIQWTNSDAEVVKQQIKIQSDLINYYPNNTRNCLIMMVSLIDKVDRVMNIGKAKTGVAMRLFNGTSIRPKNNNYIGDCRSVESPKQPQYTWRAKSAELKRRGIYKVVWAELPLSKLKLVTSALIIRKRELIEESSGIYDMKDPINCRE